MPESDSRPAGTPLPSGNGLATRRGILNVLLGGSFLSWMAVLFFPVLKYLKRPPEASGGRQMTLSDEDKKKVAQSGFTIVRVGTEHAVRLHGRGRHPRIYLHAIRTLVLAHIKNPNQER